MANYDIKILHKRILKILEQVDKICQTRGLTYYIWAGTMIGAVRHHGFIPWDDDIDIAMPREDYDRLIAHCREWLPAPLEMVCAEDDSSYPLPFAKIQDASTTLIERKHMDYVGGVYIDVFPIDGVPEGRCRRMLHFARYEYYKRVLYLLFRDPYKHGHGPNSWVPLLCRRLYTLGGVQNKIRRLLLHYPFISCNLVADYDDGSKGTMKKEVLGNPTDYAFEDATVKGVENYDSYLSNKYGDYMTVPPKEQQRQHLFYYLDFDTPYAHFKRAGK